MQVWWLVGQGSSEPIKKTLEVNWLLLIVIPPGQIV